MSIHFTISRFIVFGAERNTAYRDLELRYFRDTDGREVDFVVTENRQPILLVEAKLGTTQPDRSLRYLHDRFPDAEAWQLSLQGGNDFETPLGLRVAPPLALLSRLV